jgi:hypothetical protein
LKAKWKDWKSRNPDKVKAKNHRYTASGKSALSSKRYRANHPDYNDMTPEEHAKYKAYQIEYHKNNKHLARRNNLKKYGLNEEQFHEMLIAQSGRCAICANAFRRNHLEPAVDHCHATGKVRALLCSTCNTGLGQMKDSPLLLRAAADYLERY